jgi:hypothetical protein
MVNIKAIMEVVNSQQNIDRINADYERYVMYNGKLKEIISKAIRAEFLLPETVTSLIDRVVPINIVQKIINKLSAVYRESPIRYPVDGDDLDQEIIDFYTEEMSLNRIMKHANRMFKLHKHVAIEPYVCSEGEPRVRALPSHTYTPYSDDPIEPNKATILVKHLLMNQDPSKSRHAIWSAQEHWIVDGAGKIVAEEMNAMNNPEGINPYGVLPFVFIKDSDDLLIPLANDDLRNMQICISLLLTDLNLASKFASWSIIYLIGVENEKISFNPNSVITLPHVPGTEKPEIGKIKNDLDTVGLLAQVEALVGLLLTTNNLSVGSVSAHLDANNMASGVAKMLDESSSTEDKNDQVAFFEGAEKEFFWKLSQFIIPVWLKSGMLAPDYQKSFSDKFELGISFPDFRPSISEKDLLEVELSKLQNGLTTKAGVIKAINPGFTDLEVDSVIAEINKEKLDNVKFFDINAPEEPIEDSNQFN